ncbi:major facilitator superfamily domain-containing protein [Exophiala viscosa]|uniref:Major facilitator superfamily domain-containing protein n=1 Tax=Exophiala viscosa TaxID=2486360 RepID=A0AAN6IHP5_9EURO|nr:major facilitator superfamily domain-containing protein [Exophiala viscosa]
MSALLRDAPVGQLIRWVTRNKYLAYPEEDPNFRCPGCYQNESKGFESQATTPDVTSPELEKEAEMPAGPAGPLRQDALTKAETAIDRESMSAMSERTLSKIMTRPELSNIHTRTDLEQAYTNATRQETLKQQASRPIQPQVTSDGIILVDWYTTDDPENPQNWSRGKKGLVVLQIYLYTLAVYMGSAIFTPSEPYIMEKLGVSEQVASLGLSMYVLGYGLGPLLWSPLSEIPIIGRNPPYMITLGIFVILSIPTAAVNSFPALVVLRFLQGFFGSPCLATGGASIGDIYSLLKMPYFLTGWAAWATAGPALAPIISGFSVPAKNWHWSLWEIVWLAAPVYISLLFLLPETSASNILLRRANRLRKATGNQQLKSQSEIDQAKMSVNHIIVSNLWRPIQINALDPAVLFTSLYTALMYSIFYSFFEVFPLVYATGNPGKATHGYGMNAGEIGLIFLSITVGVSIAIPTYILYLWYVFEPEVKTIGLGEPERRLVPALFASLLLPIGLFIFGWTANNSPKIHWIVPTIGVVIFTIGIFILFQCIFIYIPLTYPQYAASLFAGNDFARSSVAAGAIHFSRPMFHNLGVGPGVSLLAGLTVGGIIGIFTLWKFGAALRARSRFAAK